MKNETKQQILGGMAKAFFASAWADQCEETGNASIMSEYDILEIMPDEIDPAASHAANTLYMQFNTALIDKLGNKHSLESEAMKYLCIEQMEGSGIEQKAESFGHYYFRRNSRADPRIRFYFKAKY